MPRISANVMMEYLKNERPGWLLISDGVLEHPFPGAEIF